MIRSLLLALACTMAVPVWASAQDGEVRDNRLIIVGGGDFGGQWRIRTKTDTAFGTVESDTDDNLLPAGHVGLQYETPIASFFVLGYRFAAFRYNVDDDLSRNRTFFDFGIAPTAVMVFQAGNLAIEPRLGMPLGFSLHHWNRDDDPNVPRTNAGLHIGVLGGVHLGSARGGGLGGIIEIGYMHHGAFAGDDDTDTRYRIGTNQMVLQAGLSLAL